MIKDMQSVREYTAATIAAALEELDPHRQFIYMGSAALVMQLFPNDTSIPAPFHGLDIDALAPRSVVDRYLKSDIPNHHITYHTHTIHPKDDSMPYFQLFEGIENEHFFINYIAAKHSPLATLATGHRSITVDEIFEQKRKVGRKRDLAQIACLLSLMPERFEATTR